MPLRWPRLRWPIAGYAIAQDRLARYRRSLTLLFLVAAAAIPTTYVALAGCYPKHDALLAYQHFAYTYSTFRHDFQIPSWDPYVAYGETTSLPDLTYLGPPHYFAMTVGAVLGLHELAAFCVALWSAQMLYLCGLMLLARELEIPFRQSLLLVLCASLLTQPFLQPDFNYGISWPLWLACWMILRFFKTLDLAYLTTLVAFGGAFLLFGHVTYGLVIQSYFLAIWLLCCTVGAIGGYIPVTQTGAGRKMRLAFWQSGGGPSVGLGRHPFVHIALLCFGALCLALLLHKVLDLKDNYFISSPGRDPTTGAVPLSVFLTYGGHSGLEKLTNIVSGPTPALDFSLFAGRLVASFAAAGVFLTLARSKAHRLRAWFVVSATLLVLLVLAFITPEKLPLAAWAYRLPGMPLVRHIAFYGQIAVPLIFLLAAVGVQLLPQARWVERALVLVLALGLCFLLPDQISILVAVLAVVAALAGARSTTLLWLLIIVEIGAHARIYGNWDLLRLDSRPPILYQSPRGPQTPPDRVQSTQSAALRDFVEATYTSPLQMERYAEEAAYLKEDYCYPSARWNLYPNPVRLLSRAIAITPADPPVKNRLYGCGIDKVGQLEPAVVASSLAGAYEATARAAAGGVFVSSVVDSGAAVAGLALSGKVSHLAVTSFSPNRIRLQLEVSDGPVLVAIYDSMHPWWSATDDGKPVSIVPANLAFKAVIVPAGSHQVVFAIDQWQNALRWLEFGLLWLAQVVALGLVGRAVLNASTGSRDDDTTRAERHSQPAPQ